MINYGKKKYDCWHNAQISLEQEILKHKNYYQFEKNTFNSNMKQLLYLKDFNSLKEFGLRLFRNNLFLNLKSYKWEKDKSKLCTHCQEKNETRLQFMVRCKKVTILTEHLEKLL